MSSDDPRIGEVFLERLKVLRHIGGGGMGAVYEVEHLRTGHHRALKIVRPEYSAQPRYMKRLLREAKVAATLKTPHVAETLDAGVLEDGSAYVLMELLEGRALIALLEERPRLEPEEVVWIATEICQGLEIAHAQGIVHRDLKPENLFLVPSGTDGALVKILDFGISQFPESMADAPTRLTREGTILGTPFYMSPEQAAGRVMDARTDLYALGVVMYEALSGSLPFDSPTIGELFLRIAAGQYTPLEQRVPTLDPNLVAVVARAMNRDPDKRYASATELAAALAPFLGLGPAAPGRVTLKLNALVQPSAPRVPTLDYGQESRASERETAAMPGLVPADYSGTPAVGTPSLASRSTPPEPASEPPPPEPPRSDAPRSDPPRSDAPRSDPPRSDAPRSDPLRSDAPRSDAPRSVEATAMGVASTPPAGFPLRRPSSIPPPASIPASLAPPAQEPAPKPRADWRWPLLLAGLAAAFAFSWARFSHPDEGASPPVTAGHQSSTDAGAAVAEVTTSPATDHGASAVFDATVAAPPLRDAGTLAPPETTMASARDAARPRSPMMRPTNHGRPSTAAGLDDNPY